MEYKMVSESKIGAKNRERMEVGGAREGEEKLA